MAQDNSDSRYALQVRVPVTLARAIKTAAHREMTTLSEYARRVLIDRLRADGIDPAVAPPVLGCAKTKSDFVVMPSGT
jgi:hypothetical protein